MKTERFYLKHLYNIVISIILYFHHNSNIVKSLYVHLIFNLFKYSNNY